MKIFYLGQNGSAHLKQGSLTELWEILLSAHIKPYLLLHRTSIFGGKVTVINSMYIIRDPLSILI